MLIATALLISCGRETGEPPQAVPQCSEQISGSSASLRGLGAVDSRVAWASGSGGTVARTLDGGATWSAAVVAGFESFDFRDVEAFDQDSALLMSAGRPAVFLKTDDGGTAWREVYRNDEEGVFFDSMAFWDRRRGLAFSDPVGDAFLVVATDDGGESWRRIPAQSLSAPLPGEAGFAASGTSLAVAGQSEAWVATGGAVARVFFTRDGGTTWAVSATPIRSGAASQGIFSIAFRDPLHGVAVGGDYQDPESRLANAALSMDGGATWRLVEGPPPGGYRSAVAWLGGANAQSLIATGPSGTDFSPDGGRSWTPLTRQGFHALAYADGVVWASGANGAVARCR